MKFTQHAICLPRWSRRRTSEGGGEPQDARSRRRRHFGVAPAGAALRSGGGLARPGPERPDTEYIMNTPSRKPLIDQVIEAYVDWREACLEVNDRYLCWASETGPNARGPFARYVAALDAEGHAAEVYAERIGRARTYIAALEAAEQAAVLYAGVVGCRRKLPRSGGPPVEPLGGPASGARSR
jgi:hypothetical protein